MKTSWNPDQFQIQINSPDESQPNPRQIPGELQANPRGSRDDARPPRPSAPRPILSGPHPDTFRPQAGETPWVTRGEKNKTRDSLAAKKEKLYYLHFDFPTKNPIRKFTSYFLTYFGKPSFRCVVQRNSTSCRIRLERYLGWNKSTEWNVEEVRCTLW